MRFCRPWASALVAKAAETIGVSLGVSENGAAFSGRDLLVGVKAEDGEIAETPDATLIEFGADGFAGIFENDELMAIRELAESEHVGRNAEGMDDENGAGARREDALDGRRSEIESDRIDVREDRRGADLQDGIGDGNEGEGGNDDFVAFADAKGEQGHVKAGGSAADGDGVGNGVIGGEGGFESGEFGAEAEVGSAQNGGDGGDFCFGDVGG